MEECSLVDEIKAGTFLIENIESEEFITESKDNIKNELFYDEEQMQECSPAGEIKTEICLNENTESEKLLAESKGSIKNELFYEEEQTQGKLELANDRDRIKTEGGVYDDKQNYKFKTGIEDIMDSFKVEPSEKVQDLVINEELDIKSDTDFVDMAMSENSLQSCSDDTQDSFQSREGMQNSIYNSENEDICGENSDETNELKMGNQVKRMNSEEHNVRQKIRHECNDCGFSTGNVKLLRSHRKNKHPNGIFEEFKCNLCDFTTNYKSNLQRHSGTVHLKFKKYVCHFCDYGALEETAVKIHIKSVHSFTWASSSSSHRETKHSNEVLHESKSDFCDFNAKKKSQLKYHMDGIHRDKKYKCNDCEFSSIWKNCLRKHRIIKHSDGMDKEFKCNSCDYVAKLKEYLDKHIKRVHLKMRYHEHSNEALDEFKCDFCDFNAKKKSQLKYHIEGNHRDKKYKCKDCEFSSIWSDSLRRHRIIKHPDGMDKEFKCNSCDYVAKLKPYLDKHIKRVHLKMRYKCNECDFSTTCFYYLNKHRKFEHPTGDETEFKCDSCNYVTKLKSYLSVHINNVHLKKRYKCKECDVSFASNSGLYSHSKIKHSSGDVNKFKCNSCDFITKYKSDLNVHINRLHLKKRFECDQCDFSTAWESSIKFHRKIKHQNIPEVKCNLKLND